MADEPYQSLYRQYRPQRFSEVRGQDHITVALRNAVRTNRAGHAYLFSGPRGTGKTSTARILAKALNCAAVEDGEPCGVCESCVAVRAGSSLDVLELDAASNSGVDAMRDLVARAALGSPGRWKVYIVDEVHMLSTAASNALLKTLEEPPGHVVFVLATTDPQKVLPTLRSRTQLYDFHLLGNEVLNELVSDVNEAAGLGLDDGAVQRVVRKGNGSARDALSVLDQVVAAGEATEDLDTAAAVVEALCERDVAAVLETVATACALGRDPRRIAVEVIERLRDGFLATMGPHVALPEPDAVAVEEQARRLGPPALVRALEVLGEALVVMRDALDTRVTLEVALIRLVAPEADTSVGALLDRIDRLERRLAETAGAPASESAPTTARAVKPDQAATAAVGPAASRAALGAFKRRDERPSGATRPPPAATPPPSVPPAVPHATAPVGVGGDVPDRDEITKAWGDSIVAALESGVRAVFLGGRWLAVEEGTAVFAVPNAPHRQRAEKKSGSVEEALSRHFGVKVRVRVVEEQDPVRPGAPSPPEELVTAAEVADMEVAPAGPPEVSAEERLRQAFPGAEEVP
jgi:DNA polymerase-3 subunit gamma/tau